MIKGKVVASALIGMISAGSAFAQDATSTADLKAQIDALQKKVNQIEAREASMPQQQQTISQVQADAANQGSLQMVAGWDGKSFMIGSKDGKFTLSPTFQFQFRNSTNYRSDQKAGGGDDLQNGFELRRMKFGIQGNVFSKDLSYKFLWATNRNGGQLTLEEGWARYKFADQFYARVGQFKDPLARESMMSSVSLLSAERSYQTDIFYGGDNFVQGAALGWDDGGPLKAEVAFTDGANSYNNNFQDPPLPAGSTASVDANFGVAGRVDYLVFGDPKALNNFSGEGVKEDTLGIGGGVDYTQGERTGASTLSTVRYTADALWKLSSGWAFFGALNGQYVDVASGGNSTNIGGLGQVAYAVNENVEVFGRYGYVNFDTVPGGASSDIHELTAGVNYYFFPKFANNCKFTLDCTYLPNGAPFADSGADILASNNDQVVVRAQFQLAL